MQTLAAATPHPGVLLKVLTAMHIKYSLISLAPLPWSVGLDTRKNPPHSVFHSLQVFFPWEKLYFVLFTDDHNLYLYRNLFSVPQVFHSIVCALRSLLKVSSKDPTAGIDFFGLFFFF